MSTKEETPKQTYIPPHLRNKSSDSTETPQDKTINYYGLRIGNLSSATTEEDVRELCQVFGKLRRVHLCVDKLTNITKGFAFVVFYDKETAANALKNLKGYGYDNLILNVDYSIDRKKLS